MEKIDVVGCVLSGVVAFLWATLAKDFSVSAAALYAAVIVIAFGVICTFVYRLEAWLSDF